MLAGPRHDLNAVRNFYLLETQLSFLMGFLLVQVVGFYQPSSLTMTKHYIDHSSLTVMHDCEDHDLSVSS